MGGPIVISYEVEGRRYTFGGLDEGELAEVLPEVKAVDPSPVIIPDGLADLRERLPAGSRVRTCRHWQHGHGTVVESCGLPGYARWPEVRPAAWFLGHDGAEVCVRFDGDQGASWWPSKWIERVQ